MEIIMKQFKAENLTVKVFDTREEMGEMAAQEAIACVKQLLNGQETVNIVFAAAPSQNDFLKRLSEDKEIDWKRIHAFHMDEYIGLSSTAPQGFGNFLAERVFDKLPFGNIFYLNADGYSAEELCERYEKLLTDYPTDIVFMGIGENGHIAFNDPHVAFFNDTKKVKIVDLDIACRQQQVNDGCFASLGEVPTHAITLTIPALAAGKHLFCMVPTALKANAVLATVEGDIVELCPASILRRHPSATLYLDVNSAIMLKN